MFFFTELGLDGRISQHLDQVSRKNPGNSSALIMGVTNNTIDTEIKAKAKQYDFRINSLQNYESECESVIQGEVYVDMNAKDHLSN